MDIYATDVFNYGIITNIITHDITCSAFGTINHENHNTFMKTSKHRILKEIFMINYVKANVDFQLYT